MSKSENEIQIAEDLSDIDRELKQAFNMIELQVRRSSTFNRLVKALNRAALAVECNPPKPDKKDFLKKFKNKLYELASAIKSVLTLLADKRSLSPQLSSLFRSKLIPTSDGKTDSAVSFNQTILEFKLTRHPHEHQTNCCII